MSSVDKHIKDLIQFYVKENYKHYLTKNNITHIHSIFLNMFISLNRFIYITDCIRIEELSFFIY